MISASTVFADSRAPILPLIVYVPTNVGGTITRQTPSGPEVHDVPSTNKKSFLSDLLNSRFSVVLQYDRYVQATPSRSEQYSVSSPRLMQTALPSHTPICAVQSVDPARSLPHRGGQKSGVSTTHICSDLSG